MSPPTLGNRVPRPGAGFLALPGVVIVAQKTFYDTLYAYKGWPRPKQESQSFPSSSPHKGPL